MDKLELSKLLIAASVIDHRNVEPETVDMWHEVIGHLQVEYAFAAVIEHFRESTDYLKPAHINHRAMMIEFSNKSDVADAKRRGLIPLDYPANKLMDKSDKARLNADRDARRGIDDRDEWYPDEETYFAVMEKRGVRHLGYHMAGNLAYRYQQHIGLTV